MIKFLIKSGLFFIFTFIFLFFGKLIIDNSINQDSFFKINKEFDYLIIGNSHTQRALNDSIVKKSINLSASAESVFYTYLKIKKISENNKINNIFLSFSNNCIPIVYDEYIWKETYVSRFYPIYHSFMSLDEYKILIKNNKLSLLRIQSYSTKKDLEFLISNNNNALQFYGWGGYDYSTLNELDSILKNKNDIPEENIKEFKYSKLGLHYTDKIIKLCNEKKINLFLIRCPIHKSWNKLANEYYFQKLIHQKYKNVNFLDFKDFPVPDNYYGDQNHLNHLGASKFSLFFNKLLENGLLMKINKQRFINQEIQKEKLSK